MEKCVEYLDKIWASLARIFIYFYIVLFAFFVRRRIDIREVQISGRENFWQVSYQVSVSTPNRRMRLEFLRACPENTRFYRIASAIRVAEDICTEKFLPATPVFIKIERRTIPVIVREN
jgi:hypothetical protein